MSDLLVEKAARAVFLNPLVSINAKLEP